MPKQVEAVEANYVILTAEQFATDYPHAVGEEPEGATTGDKVLAIHDDADELITAIWGDVNTLATLTGDMAKYVASNANPGKVEPKVGPNKTVLADR